MVQKTILALMLIFLCVGNLLAATDSDPALRSLQGMGAVGGANQTFQPAAGTDELLPSSDDIRDDLVEEGDSTARSAGKSLERLRGMGSQEVRRKPALVVQTEPGDGLVKLRWKLINYPAKWNQGNARYTVRYGIESEKLAGSQQVGKNQEYVLRELKNNQQYYIQVVATDREQQFVYKSDEIAVTPRPAELLGSLLENNFSRKTVTMMDKNEPEKLERELKQFGYDFFRNSSQLLQSGENLPASDDYRVGPGDSLKLSIWGAFNAQVDLTVDRSGELLIPKVGAVKVWGLTLEQAKTTVRTAISRYYRNFEMNISMGRLRTIQVYVVGEVEAPGSYPVSSLSTIINALAAAGGPSRNGSLRQIRVSRGTQTLDTVDLYDMLLTGDRSKDLRLQNGDTIFVPVIGQVVAVAGEVRRPAIYELHGETTLKNILSMAGGVTASGDTGRIQLERLSANATRIVQDVVASTETKDRVWTGVLLQDRDMVKVYPVPVATRQVVSLKGNVQRPGEYQYTTGMHLTDLIQSTRDLLPETFLESVEITRILPPDYRREQLTVNLRSALAGNQHDNILLQEQDSVKVFSRWEMTEKPRVAVNGAVLNPGVYDYYPGMSVRDLVTASGSTRRNAYLDQAELSRIVVSGDKAESRRIALDLSKALAGNPDHNIPLQTDDVLIVRSVADWIDATDKFVTLKGEVRFPGVYTVARGEKLSSVIARAGGYTEKAYLFGAKFTRKSVREQQQKRMDEVLSRTEKEITQKQIALTSTAASKEELEATKVTLEGMLQGIEKMRKLKAEGRVVLRLAQLDALKTSSYDLEMEGGDVVDIPPRPGVVHVMGQVYNQTTFVYLSDTAGVAEYLAKAGGATKDGEEDDMYIIRADGSVLSRQQSSFGISWSDESRNWSFGGFMAKTVLPGDTIVVPQKIERIAWMRDIKDITQILANVAMTAGSMFLWFK